MLFYRFLVVFVIFRTVLTTNIISREEQQAWELIVETHQRIFMPHRASFIQLVNNITRDFGGRISPSCWSSLELYAMALGKGDAEAMTMYDSSARDWTGILYDQDVDFGHYHQCLDTKFNRSSTRYTLLEIDPPRIRHEDLLNDEGRFNNSWTSQFRRHIGRRHKTIQVLALCLPSKCSEKDIKMVVESNEIQKLVSPLKISLHSSQAKEDDNFSQFRVISNMAYSVILLIVILNIYATTFTNSSKVLQCFNMSVNHQKLTEVRQVDDDRLHFYTFYKVLYLFIGFSVHVLLPLNMAYVPLLTPVYWDIRRKELGAGVHIIFLGLPMTIMVAASLATMTLLPLLGKVPLPMVLLFRLIRTLPVLVLAVLMQLAIPVAYPFIASRGNGPLFDAVYVNQAMNCIRSGWKEILLAGNLLRSDETCVIVDWYVSLDFQMFVLSLVLMVALKKSFKAGIFVAIIQIALGLLLHFHQAGTANRPYAVLFTEYDEEISLGWYTKQTHPFGYIAVYPIGVFLGYAVLNSKPDKTYRSTIIGWLSFIATNVLVNSIAFGVYDKYGGPRTSAFIELILTVLQKPLYSIIISLFFYYGLMNSETIIRLGKSTVCNFLCKISYSTFIFTNIFIIFVMARRSRPIDTEAVYLIGIHAYIIVVSILGGYLMTLMFEVPVSNMFKLFLPDKSQILKEKQ